MDCVEQKCHEMAQNAPIESEGSLPGAACSGRREFFVRAGMTAGGLVLGLTALRAGAEDNGNGANVVGVDANGAKVAGDDEIVLKLADPSPLSQVGGFTTVDTNVGKVVVARTGDATFAACSAVCTHRGGPIVFDAKNNQFNCPWHHSIFATDGSVVHGPAREPLKSYGAQTAVAVTLKTT